MDAAEVVDAAEDDVPRDEEGTVLVGLATVEVVVLTELVMLVVLLVLVLVVVALELDVVDGTVLVGSATDLVVYGTTVVLTGSVEVTVLVVLMKQDLPMESTQLVVLTVVVVSTWSSALNFTGLLEASVRIKTHKRYWWCTG